MITKKYWTILATTTNSSRLWSKPTAGEFQWTYNQAAYSINELLLELNASIINIRWEYTLITVGAFSFHVFVHVSCEMERCRPYTSGVNLKIVRPTTEKVLSPQRQKRNDIHWTNMTENKCKKQHCSVMFSGVEGQHANYYPSFVMIMDDVAVLFSLCTLYTNSDGWSLLYTHKLMI